MPFIFGVLPVTTAQLCSKFYPNCLRPTVNIAFQLFGYAPLINATFSIILIRCYRLYVLKKLMELPFIGTRLKSYVDKSNNSIFVSNQTLTNNTNHSQVRPVQMEKQVGVGKLPNRGVSLPTSPNGSTSLGNKENSNGNRNSGKYKIIKNSSRLIL